MTDAGAAARRSPLVNLPNLLSALRLPIAAAFFAIDGLLWRGVLLSLGALTDALDGWLARHLGVESPTGAILDPLFDKLFVLVALAAFLSGPYLEPTGFLILVARDLYVGTAYVGGRIAGLPVPARSRLAGKVVTFLQMVTLFVLLLAPDLIGYFTLAVGLSAVVAVVDYTAVALAAVREDGAKG